MNKLDMLLRKIVNFQAERFTKTKEELENTILTMVNENRIRFQSF